MPDFLVTVKYDTHAVYLVQDVSDHNAARKYVRETIILYDPGVPVEVTETPIDKNKTQRFSNLGGFKD